MKAFAMDQFLTRSYERFSRSFTSIRAYDLRDETDAQYTAGRFWPQALLSLNPEYLPGATVTELAAKGRLDEATGEIFRFGETPLRLYRHQEQAIAKANAGKSFIVTTGTGSGKSLCFFIPIADRILRARRRGEPRRTSAIVIYPMNALANSQIKEIGKFIANSGLPEDMKPRVCRYTGQESAEERQEIAANPPDILLTNFMMAELLLTRQNEIDRKVMENARGLDFIVLDELHTYRGRQGADVAVLVRRLKDRCSPDRSPVCIGTSATMANEGAVEHRAEAVASVASRLFGISLGADDVIDETLKRVTDDSLKLHDVMPHLARTLKAGFADNLDNESLRRNPLSVWTELRIGLKDGPRLTRRKPVCLDEAVSLLARDSGLDEKLCAERLEQFLTLVSQPETARGGTGDQTFLAFKLHRFISGAGEIYTTLKPAPRHVLFEGQIEDPEDPGTRLYPTRFCRNCGQEFHVVTRVKSDEGVRYLPRDIDDQPLREQEEDDEIAGYLTPAGDGDDEYRFTGEFDSFPEDWLEERKGIMRLRSNRKKQAPVQERINRLGEADDSGKTFWFLPGRFAFCPCCLDQPVPQMRERNKLAGLSGEGRSSATTLLVSSALEWMNLEDSDLPKEKRKILGFTDNRQDAALQAGHFNDFMFVSLLRGGILRAVQDAGEDGLAEEEFGLRVTRALGFTADNKIWRTHWMQEPTAGAVIREDAQRALAKVLAHRVWADLRRGWRYTNPNLAILQLVKTEFLGLDEISKDETRLRGILPEQAGLDPSGRKRVLALLLQAMVESLAVATEALDLTMLDSVANRSRNLLRAPWAIDHEEKPASKTVLVLSVPRKLPKGKRAGHYRDERLVSSGHNSRIGRIINRPDVIGHKLGRDQYLSFMSGLLELLEHEGLLKRKEINEETNGWQINPAAVRLVPGPALLDGKPRGNRYFHSLYMTIAQNLADGKNTFAGLESREHTAQVDQVLREWREWRFRYEKEDRTRLQKHAAELKAAGESEQFLPALFCSPTMELGVDISALNAVYLRNVPPTPANYAQRAGRAGRSGQAAAITTYCAAQSPHDQYFFHRKEEMVSGIVRPPALDIANEELVRSHLHAVWLAESSLALAPNIPEILDLDKDGYPLRSEIAETIRTRDLAIRSRKAMNRILTQILSSIKGGRPSWLEDRDLFVQEVACAAPEAFDRAFDRWRELYRSAHAQLKQAHERSRMAGLSAKDRNRAKAAWAQANDQIGILEQGKATFGSDFYSYRYLATEGFLPGYNFPRLPLYAFIPGEHRGGSFIQRARFLGISEFGPRSLIYHEGRAYRVIKAKLPPEIRDSGGDGLATKDIYICSNCGACHDEDVEKCHACGASMAQEIPIQHTLRIDNVEAAPAERITANDEERIRQGFDIQTVYSWPRQNGKLKTSKAEFTCEDQVILTLQYANSAEISRINKGLRRRKDETILGFYIDPRTGRWERTPDEDPGGDNDPEIIRPVRIVPIVRDRKNALVLRFANPQEYALETLATVQQAILRGIEIVYQLEEGEIQGEPLPTRDNRRALLLFEATEGGAGVLGRLIAEPDAIGKVAREALALMHFDNMDEAISNGDPGLLTDTEEACVRGCYRCLLSYYNQPEHERINRRDAGAMQFLICLARGELKPEILADDSLQENGWITVFAKSGIPMPDKAPKTFGGQLMPFVWRSHFVAAATAPLTSAASDEAEAGGWSLHRLPQEPAMNLPADFIALFED